MKDMTELRLSIPKTAIHRLMETWQQFDKLIIASLLAALSICTFLYFHFSGLTLAYNDARSHLDIGRRVVEGLKPGLAQLGSVWLPLPHILMIPTIWNDFMWHTGLSGALQSMFSFVVTALIIQAFLKQLKVGVVGQLVGIAIFALNLNILYLQSTAMTELLLIATMTAAVYELLLFHQKGDLFHLTKSAFWVMLSTLNRYDGWFLFFYTACLVALYGWRKRGYLMSEGMFILFCTLAGFGVFLWVVWNTAIFKDPLYFAFGPYSAHAQQEQLDQAGVLLTKQNLGLSILTYWYAMAYNTGTFVLVIGLIGAGLLYLDKKIPVDARIAVTALMAPLVFNILALYLGHSVLFVQNINGNTWFNVRYGIMMMPSIAVFIGYLVNRVKVIRPLLIGLLAFVFFFQFTSFDAVTIDDGRVGSSQKNVSEVSNWLRDHTRDQKGFILISAASHDAIIFSSGLPMSRFIHEGTGTYWLNATSSPDRWARWIVMRTNDNNDQTFKLVNQSGALSKYDLVDSYPFADIYQLKPEYMSQLQTEPVLGKQR